MGRRIEVFVTLGTARIEASYDLPEGWDDMTPEEQDAELNEYAQNHLANHVDFAAYVSDN